VAADAARALTGRAEPFAIRPELIELLEPGAAVPNGAVHCTGTVLDVLYHGASSRWRIRVDDGTTLAVAQADVAADGGDSTLAPGMPVQLAWRPEHAVTLQG